jgi:hypothetical protein
MLRATVSPPTRISTSRELRSVSTRPYGLRACTRACSSSSYQSSWRQENVTWPASFGCGSVQAAPTAWSDPARTVHVDPPSASRDSSTSASATTSSRGTK